MILLIYFLSRIHAVELNPHPDPLPFTKGEGNLRWRRVRVTEQGPGKRAFQFSSPRSERREDQDEGRFRLHTYGLGGGFVTRVAGPGVTAPGVTEPGVTELGVTELGPTF